MAVGDAEGTVTMLKLSDALSQLQKDEKQVSGALFEREMRREKVLEARARELKLKEREKNKPKVEEEEPENTDEVDPLQEIQEDLENCLIAERKKLAPLAKSLLED